MSTSPIFLGDMSAWARDSLEQGTGIAVGLSGRVDEFTDVSVLVPESTMLVGEVDFAHSAGVTVKNADLVLEQFLEQATKGRNLQTFLVEDDLARRGDAHLTGEFAYVGERVVRWRELASGSISTAVKLVRDGSAGYPLNAFGLSQSAADLGIAPGVDLESDAVAAIIDTAQLLIVGAFDGEAFIGLVRET